MRQTIRAKALEPGLARLAALSSVMVLTGVGALLPAEAGPGLTFAGMLVAAIAWAIGAAHAKRG